MSSSTSAAATGSVTAIFAPTAFTSANPVNVNVTGRSELPGQELRERLQSVIAARDKTQQQQIATDNVTTTESETLGTPSVAGTTEANHRLHMLLPRIQSRLAQLAAIQAQTAEAEARSQAAPATSQSQLPAPASDSDTDNDSASSDTDSESGGALTPPSIVETMSIPIVLVTDHSDIVLGCVDHPEGEGEGEFGGMTSLSYHGDLSELAKEDGNAMEGKMVGPFRFPAPRCDAKELLSPQAVPRSMWTKKCRPAQHLQQQSQPRQFQYKPDAPLSAGRVLEIEEMGRLLEALTKQGSGLEFDEQRMKDRDALGLLMERMRREIEEEGCSRKEANTILFQVLKSVGLGLQRKADEEVEV